MSYCWGSPDQQQKIILVKQKFVIVKSALHALVDEKPWLDDLTLPFWIDAVCINQADSVEKSSQVLLMGDICLDATFVCVWLGQDENTSSELLDLIQDEGPGFDPSPAYLEAFKRLIKRPRFHRLWVVQETVLARQHTLLLSSGYGLCSWEQFELHVDMCVSSSLELEVTNYETHTHTILGASLQLSPLSRTINLRRQVWVDDKRHTPPLSYLWSTLRQFHATDPQDKVYVVLGMSSLQQIQGFP